MAISKTQKEEVLAQLSTDLGNVKLVVLTDYRGLRVVEVEELRDKLAQENMSYRVTKNTLLKLAVSQTPALKNLDLSVFKGPMALAMGFDDEVAPARLIFQFAKAHKALEIVGAITGDGQLLSAAQVKALASLPSREQLLGQVVGTIAAPLSSFMSVLSGNIRNLFYVLNAINESK